MLSTPKHLVYQMRDRSVPKVLSLSPEHPYIEAGGYWNVLRCLGVSRLGSGTLGPSILWDVSLGVLGC